MHPQPDPMVLPMVGGQPRLGGLMNARVFLHRFGAARGDQIWSPRPGQAHAAGANVQAHPSPFTPAPWECRSSAPCSRAS